MKNWIPVLGLFLVSNVSASGEALIVGVQEDRPGVFAGEKHKFQIRVLFKKEDLEWKAFPSHTLSAVDYPLEVNWTIALNGKKLSEEKTKRPVKFEFYSDVGQHLIENQEAAEKLGQKVGKRSSEFAGFNGERIYRPLAAISQPNYQDPEEWKPGNPPASLLEKAKQAFKTQFAKELGCPEKCQEIEKKITLASKSYKSKIGGWVLPMAFPTSTKEDAKEFFSATCLMSPTSAPTFIPGELKLIEAADFDHDGKTELLFKLTGYNVGGYVLAYGNSQKTAKFQYNYH
jgi:hypothetical protein